jgi:hypothetical protein
MKIDMSPQAISTRLKLVSQLRRLCLSLAKAKPVQSRAPADEKKLKMKNQA